MGSRAHAPPISLAIAAPRSDCSRSARGLSFAVTPAEGDAVTSSAVLNGAGDEPSTRPAPSRAEARLNKMLGRAANILSSAVAILLIVFVVIALVGVVIDGLEPLRSRGDFTTSAVQGVNSAFLAIILLELVHTTVSRGPMTRQLQEFLVIGVTVGVRSGLAVAAGASEHGTRDVAINLGLNATAVLILVVALCVVRWRLQSELRERGDHD
jgi:uncharacterized membrane protein (DUF373 family)